MGIGKFVSSSTFSVSGYDWNMRIYPDGWKEEGKAAYMAVSLGFCSKPTTGGVKVKFTLSLLEKDAKVNCTWSAAYTFQSPQLKNALAEQHHAAQRKNACLGYLSSQEVLRAVKETDGFKHLTASCPWIMMDILEKVAPLPAV
ncbi:hypothetical protein VPH35_080301 [Triticum aestivum]